jgi:putative tricarboxylic transport membrane protein
MMGEMFSQFGEGLSYLGNAGYWGGFLFAILVTVPIALIPGISATLVMAIAIPFIIISVDDPVIGVAILATLTGIDNTLDSIPAILLGMPGGATQVTFLEGNQLARQGKAAHTLGAVYAVSALGGIIGALSMALVIPVIKPVVLAFHDAEIAAMAMFGVAMVAALSGGAMLKGISAALLGMLLGAVGPAPVSLDFRYMFDQDWLWDGLPLIATTIGAFALPEIIDLTMTRKSLAPPEADLSYKQIFSGARYGMSRWRMTIRQSLFGVFFGAIPGVGSGVIDWMAYALGIAFTKDKSQFGKGSLDGVLFAEAAQNSKEGGQAIPTLALGIPGGRAWAFVMLGMLSYGIAPGPRMLTSHADITIMIVLSLGLGNLAVTMLGLGFTGQMAKLTKIPYPVLGFIIIPISFLAAYQNHPDISVIGIVLVGAVLGLLMKRYKWPRPPMLIGFILGPIIEAKLTNSLGLYGWVGTFTRPFFLVLFIIAIATAVIFTKYMKIGSGTPPVETVAPPAGAAPDAPAGWTSKLTSLTWQFRETQWFSFIVMVIGAYAWYEATSFSSRGQWFPVGIAVPILVLSTAQFLREGFGAKTGDIMDIGIRSAGMEGARSAGLLIIGVITLMIVGAGLFGLQYSAILVALLGPPLIMQNRVGVYGGLVGGTLITLLNWFFFGGIFGSDGVVAVIWPDKFILEWFN